MVIKFQEKKTLLQKENKKEYPVDVEFVISYFNVVIVINSLSYVKVVANQVVVTLH
jgi:hypothetical protein